MSVSAGSARAVDPHAGPGLAPPRTAVATVCMSGTLEDKLAAAAAAGFDGVEIFEPDFVASPLSAARGPCAAAPTWACRSTSTSRSATSTRPTPSGSRRTCGAPSASSTSWRQLGTDLILVCSAVSPDAVDDDDRIAEQLHSLAERAARARPARSSYEALAWGTHVNTYDRSWDIVRARRPPGAGAVRRQLPHPVPRLATRPGSATSPARSCSSCSWPTPRTWTWTCSSGAGTTGSSRARAPSTCPPSSDTCWPPATPGRCRSRCSTTCSARPTRAGPRSTPCGRCSRWTRRVRDPAQGHLPAGVEVGGQSLPPTPALHGFAFAELAVDDDCEPAVARTLTALGFRHAGTHRTKPVQLWSQRRRAGAAQRASGAGRATDRRRRRGARRRDRRPAGRRGARDRRCSRRCCPAPAARPRPTCRRSPPRTGRRCSSAARGPRTGGSTDFPGRRRRRAPDRDR